MWIQMWIHNEDNYIKNHHILSVGTCRDRQFCRSYLWVVLRGLMKISQVKEDFIKWYNGDIMKDIFFQKVENLWPNHIIKMNMLYTLKQALNQGLEGKKYLRVKKL